MRGFRGDFLGTISCFWILEVGLVTIFHLFMLSPPGPLKGVAFWALDHMKCNQFGSFKILKAKIKNLHSRPLEGI
jgi:hypothetical protein